MIRRTLVTVALVVLAGCASLPSPTSIQKIVDDILAVKQAGVTAFCALPPGWRDKALAELRKHAPAANIICGGGLVASAPTVTGVPGWR